MILVPAEELFAQARYLLEGRDKDGNEHPKDLDKSEKLLHEILNHNVGNETVLYVMGTCHMAKGNFGLAIQILSQVTQMRPTFGEAWNNLGLAYRGANDYDRSAYCLAEACKYIAHADLPCNLAGAYLVRHTPE